ncbi:MAG: AMP-binding protein [Gammaproteobacteria bacterium]|nr:AMP-binding protein [Gammaproteobacteria bacterium]MCW5583277.1 AMP-binding protein [Gammaproteobacteria bacterium]
MNKTSRYDIEKELIAITNKFLTDSGEPYKREIKTDVSLHRHLGIDSLGRAELFRRIEKSFDVRISDHLLTEADTLNDIAKYLHEFKPSVEAVTKHEIVASHGERPHVDPSQAKTLLDILLLYGEKSPDKAHIYFQNEDGGEEVITYGQLLHVSSQVALGLRERGLKERETVAIMQPTSPKFFYTFFGILLAGGIPVPIYPPFRMHMLEAYAKTEARILRNAEVRILVTFEQAENLSLLLQSFVPSLKHVTTVDELTHQDKLIKLFHASADNPALIQYTSGSTSDPKGVLLSHHNLLSNIQAYGRAINVTPNDVAVSWLPLYHDMGLIGMWLGSLYYGVPLILLTPFSFLNRPERWLWAIHYHRGTLSGAPNFAYELCVRKIDPGLVEGLDLSSWRMAANGAEKIYPRTLEQFAKKFAPFGFKQKALLPVYGLAESTVALTIPPIDREFKVDCINREAFEKDRRAVPEEGKDTLAFVSCGAVIEGHAVRIVDDNNNVLPERTIGNLQFRGPSSMQGFYNNPRATQLIYHDGWLDSGDLAYQAENEFYITGRKKDLIIKAGRNLYPAEIEELAGGVEGVRQGCVAAFEVSDAQHGTEQLIVVAETREKNKSKQEAIANAIKEVIVTSLDIAPDHVVLVAPHIVPKTSSGKLQRAACKTMYLAGRLSKRQMPAWLQIVKLGVQSLVRKCIMGLGLMAKFIYTLYVALMIGITFFPMFLLVKYSSRDMAAKSVRSWAKWILRFALCPIKIVGANKLAQDLPVIFASNHASYIDSIVMVSILPINTRIVVKKELMHMPLVRTVMQKLEYLGVDRMDLSKGLEDTKRIQDILTAGHPILIFPEGTFGYPSGLRPFRLGAFKISAETNTSICPVALKGTRYILRDDEKLMRPKRVVVTICDLIQPVGAEWEHVTQLRNLVRAEIVKHCGEPSLDFIAAQTVAPKWRQ